MIGRARTSLLAGASQVDARALDLLGAGLAPDRPSWFNPLGTPGGLGAASDEAVAVRAAALRAGPWRVAVIANVDAAQAEAAVRAVDRWIARRPGEARICPPLPSLAAIRPGTYAVDLPVGAEPEVLLAAPLVATDPAMIAAARWMAAALDGPRGILARALGSPVPGDDAGAPLATAWNASLIGAPHRPALALRLIAPDAQLDAAVAQTRVLLDRLRQGAFREEDRTRAAAVLSRQSLDAALDPRARLVDLWRGAQVSLPPSLDALRAFASMTLHDDALVIVAARPPRLEADRAVAGARDARSGRRAGGRD
jgi:hypothetical protein